MVEWILEFVAELVTVNKVNSFTVWVITTANVGETFTSFTIKVNVFVAVRDGFTKS